MEGNLPLFLCFTLYLRVISQYKPPGGLYLEGRFNGGFCTLRVWGAYTWRGLFSKFYGSWQVDKLNYTCIVAHLKWHKKASLWACACRPISYIFPPDLLFYMLIICLLFCLYFIVIRIDQLLWMSNVEVVYEVSTLRVRLVVVSWFQFLVIVALE